MGRRNKDARQSWESFLNDFERDELAEHVARRRANPPENEWEKIYEMWGACSLPPWPHTWQEYFRMYTGWKRHRWEMTAELACMMANGPLRKEKGGLWHPSDLCEMMMPPVKWIKKSRKGNPDVCRSDKGG